MPVNIKKEIIFLMASRVPKRRQSIRLVMFTLQKDNKNKNKFACIQLIEQGQPCPTATFDIDTIEASFHDQQFTHP
jgi:hypothetical protein